VGDGHGYGVRDSRAGHRHTLKRFQPVEHRTEFNREVSGVRFYNDSKGTNVDSTIQAVRAMIGPR
jgi:UDP-N-acetylmuramoylalanine-D-glutamate ligase